MYLKNEIDDIDKVIDYTLTIAIAVIFKDKTEFQCTHFSYNRIFCIWKAHFTIQPKMPFADLRGLLSFYSQ